MKLLTARNKLTRYALACGYIERTETPKYFITLYMDGSTIMVRVYNRERKELGQNNYRTMSSAYKAYNAYRRMYVIQE